MPRKGRLNGRKSSFAWNLKRLKVGKCGECGACAPGFLGRKARGKARNDEEKFVKEVRLGMTGENDWMASCDGLADRIKELKNKA